MLLHMSSFLSPSILGSSIRRIVEPGIKPPEVGNGPLTRWTLAALKKKAPDALEVSDAGSSFHTFSDFELYELSIGSSYDWVWLEWSMACRNSADLRIQGEVGMI